MIDIMRKYRYAPGLFLLFVKISADQSQSGFYSEIFLLKSGYYIIIILFSQFTICQSLPFRNGFIKWHRSSDKEQPSIASWYSMKFALSLTLRWRLDVSLSNAVPDSNLLGEPGARFVDFSLDHRHIEPRGHPHIKAISGCLRAENHVLLGASSRWLEISSRDSWSLHVGRTRRNNHQDYQ